MATGTTATNLAPATATAAMPRAGSARRFGWTMTVPSLLAMALVVGFPLLFAAWVSVHDYDLTEGGIGAFTGLANYAKTVGDQLFTVAVQNTVVFSVSAVVLEVIAALGLSLLLNQPGLRFRNLYLAILLIPLLVGPVAVGLIWRLLLHPDLGAVNWLRTTLGFAPQEWLGGQASAMPTVIGVDVWHETSLMIVVILAGLTALLRDPLDAAMVDGGNRWQELVTVTLPLLAPVILVAVLIRLIAAMKTYDLICILTRGGPGSATETISYAIWKQAFTTLEMGRAAAGSFILLAMILALTVVPVRLTGDDR